MSNDWRKTGKGIKRIRAFAKKFLQLGPLGIIRFEKQRKINFDANSCNFDGMNGYGHTKKRRDGYIRCYVPKHPRCSIDKYVMLHTVIMERSIGRYLNEDEVVHHVNGVRDDNRIENLQRVQIRDDQSLQLKR